MLALSTLASSCTESSGRFFLAVYLGLEQMGDRSHPVLDLVYWFALAVMVTAAVVLCVEAIGAVLRLLNRRLGRRRL